jgi:ADP-glucose pyrophosphorylase
MYLKYVARNVHAARREDNATYEGCAKTSRISFLHYTQGRRRPIVCNGDVLCDVDYEDLLQFHKKNKSIAKKKETGFRNIQDYNPTGKFINNNNTMAIQNINNKLHLIK